MGIKKYDPATYGLGYIITNRMASRTPPHICPECGRIMTERCKEPTCPNHEEILTRMTRELRQAFLNNWKGIYGSSAK